MEDIDPAQAALKIYMHSETKNFTEMSLIDMQLTEQKLRYPVYEWVEDKGKFELFFEGLQESALTTKKSSSRLNFKTSWCII